MNKFITKIATLSVGLAMAIGVGVAVGNKQEVRVEAAEQTVSWTATSGGLGSGVGTGTISTGSYSWDYERTLISGASYTGWTSNCIQLGKNGGVENVEFTTSNIPGTIKSVSVECASYQGKHNVSITVGETSYLASTSTSSWTTISSKSGTGTSSGKIVISFTGGTRALYIKSISVTYEENSSVTCTGIVASLTDSSKVWKKGETVTASDVTVYAEFSDDTDATITNGAGVTITNGELAAGNNTVTVTYSGQTDDITVFGKAPTGITTVTSSGTTSISLNANGNTSVSDSFSFEVAYNTSPVTTDYAATLACASSGWTKTADDGAGNITLSFESNGTFAFTLTANDDAEVVESLTFIVSGIPTIEYELFSGSIEEGKYLITVGGDALKNTISSSRGDYAAVTVVNDKVSTPAANIIWKIEQSGSYWTIYNENVSKYFASTGVNNKAQLLASSEDDKALWTIEESSTGVYHFTNKYNSENSANAKLQKNGSYGFACYAAYSDITLYKLPEAPKTVVSSRMVNGTVSAKTGDSEWTVTGFKFFVTYEGESETEVTSNTTFAVTESIPTITENGSTNVTVTPTFKGVTYTAKAATVTATLTYVDPYSIARLYDIEITKGSTYGEVTFDGIYMGESGGGIILMNGEYGMLVYGASNNSYTIGETYLTVTGDLKNYNYLYEINSGATVSALNDSTRRSHVGTPSTYVVTGSESLDTLYLANRKTSLSGTVKSITPGTASANNTVYITVGENDIYLYIKSAQATQDVIDEFVVDNHITIEGFSSYYTTGFQVMFTNIVEADENYHAADFARDLLKLTRATCAASDEGNGSALTSIWTTLAGSEYWLKVEAAGEEDSLINGTPDSKIEVPTTDSEIDAMSDADAIAAALYRYDWCTAKYKLTNFMERELTVSFASGSFAFGIKESNNATAIIVVISLVSVTAIGGYFFLRKRKVQ